MVHAARLLGELVERGGIELRALDGDDVDRRAGLACSRDRVVQRGGAARLVAVGHDDHHACLERLVREHVRRLDDRVVERGPLDGVDLDRFERPDGVAALGREVGQELGLRGERGHGDPVLGRLRGDEATRRRDGVRERCAPHRLRTVDREDDGLLRAEVLCPVDPDGQPVLAQLRGLRARVGGQDRDAHDRERARVDAPDRDAGIGRRHGEANRSCKSDCD